MREITSEIEINTQSSNVWKILINLEKYVAWNPFIKEAEGVIEEGERLRVHIAPPDGRSMTFNPWITRVVENSELRWHRRFLLPGLFDGEHIFELVPLTENSVKFIQRENFSGLLVPLFWKNTAQSTRKGFEAMNKAIKARAESRK